MSYFRQLRYEGGQGVPQNVISSLKFAAKVGLLTTAQWHAYFGKGNLRWRQRQLKGLVDRKLIRKHQNAPEGYWVLHHGGHRLLERLDFHPVTPVAAQDLLHDSIVGSSLVDLEKKNFCERWLTGKELKRRGDKEYLIRLKDQRIIYPDALVELKRDGKTKILAMVYERNGRTVQQYKSILAQYSRFSSVELILFITDDDLIERKILSAQKHLGNYNLLERLGLVDVRDWIKAPESAPISISGRALSLNNCYEKFAR